MKRFAARWFNRQTAGALAAGLPLALALPDTNITVLAWLAPALLLGLTSASPFRLGYLAGLVHWLITLRWLLNIPVRFMPVIGWIAMSAFLALYPALWSWLVHRLARRWAAATPDVPEDAPPRPFRPLLPGLVTLRRRLVFPLAGAALWVTMEMLQGRIFTGFPWNFLGITQQKLPVLIQIASVTGVYGVSFLVAWSSLAMLVAVDAMLREPARRQAWMLAMLAPVLAVTGVCAWGLSRVTRQPVAPRDLRVALIQPAVPQELIWDGREDERRFANLLRLTTEALAEKPQVVIWPEAAVPGFPRYDRELHQALTNLVVRHRTWLLFGADDAERNGTNRPVFFNTAWLMNPDGLIVASYRKRLLVMFGEYVPLTGIFPFLRWFTPVGSGFKPGPGPVSFPLRDAGITVAPIICFEDTFPHVVREHAGPDIDALVNITNDGWFGAGSEQWQHAITAAFRAVENGLPLIRCSNNGISCWIDPTGVLHEAAPGDGRNSFAAGYRVVDVPVWRASEITPTFYRRHGDVFGWTMVILSAWLVAGTLVRQRNGSATPAGDVTP